MKYSCHVCHKVREPDEVFFMNKDDEQKGVVRCNKCRLALQEQVKLDPEKQPIAGTGDEINYKINPQPNDCPVQMDRGSRAREALDG